jgi:hypothetical protein
MIQETPLLGMPAEFAEPIAERWGRSEALLGAATDVPK